MAPQRDGSNQDRERRYARLASAPASQLARSGRSRSGNMVNHVIHEEDQPRIEQRSQRAYSPRDIIEGQTPTTPLDGATRQTSNATPNGVDNAQIHQYQRLDTASIQAAHSSASSSTVSGASSNNISNRPGDHHHPRPEASSSIHIRQHRPDQDQPRPRREQIQYRLETYLGTPQSDEQIRLGIASMTTRQEQPQQSRQLQFQPQPQLEPRRNDHQSQGRNRIDLPRRANDADADAEGDRSSRRGGR